MMLLANDLQDVKQNRLFSTALGRAALQEARGGCAGTSCVRKRCSVPTSVVTATKHTVPHIITSIPSPTETIRDNYYLRDAEKHECGPGEKN